MRQEICESTLPIIHDTIRDDEQSEPGAATRSMGNHRVSLRTRLGISESEVEALRAKRTTTATGLANLVREDHWSGFTGGSGSGSEHDVTPVGMSYIAFLLDHLNVPPDKARALMLRKPAVLDWSAMEAEAMSRWLRANLKVDREEAGLLLLKLATVGPADILGVLAPIAAWVSETLANNTKRVGLPGQRHKGLPRDSDQQLWMEQQQLDVFKAKDSNILYDVLRILGRAPLILQRSVGESL